MIGNSLNNKYKADLIEMFNSQLDRIDHYCIRNEKMHKLAIEHLNRILSTGVEHLVNEQAKVELRQRQVQETFSSEEQGLAVNLVQKATQFLTKAPMDVAAQDELSQEIDEIEELLRDPAMYAVEEHHETAKELLLDRMLHKLSELKQPTYLQKRQKEIEQSNEQRQLEQARISEAQKNLADKKSSTLSEFEYLIAQSIYSDLLETNPEISFTRIENFIFRIKQEENHQQLDQENQEENLRNAAELISFLVQNESFDSNSDEAWAKISPKMITYAEDMQTMIDSGVSLSEIFNLEEPLRSKILENSSEVSALLEQGISLPDIIALEEPLRSKVIENGWGICFLLKKGIMLSDLKALEESFRNKVIENSWGVKALLEAEISLSNIQALEEPFRSKVMKNSLGISALAQRGVSLSDIKALEEPLRSKVMENGQGISALVKSRVSLSFIMALEEPLRNKVMENGQRISDLLEKGVSFSHTIEFIKRT